MSYHIGEASAASPDMDPEEFSRLKDSIATLGQLVPILVTGEQVVDGRKRLLACEQLGIAPRVVEVGGATAEVAEAANLLRTHYTPSQRAMFAARLANLKIGNVAAQRAGTGISAPVSNAEAAHRFAVDLSSVGEAKKLRREAAPEVVEAVERGHLTLHAAQQIAKHLPKEAQAAKVVELKEMPSGKRKQVANTLPGGSTFRRLPKKSAADVLERCVSMIEAAAQTIENTERTKLRASDAQEWATRLGEALPPIRTFLKEIESVYGKRHA